MRMPRLRRHARVAPTTFVNKPKPNKSVAGKKKKDDGARDRGGFKASRHGDGKRASASGPKASQKKAAEEREAAGAKHTSHEGSKFLRGGRIEPKRITGAESTADLIDNTFLAYNAARLREGC